jgi:hypothetical protein
MLQTRPFPSKRLFKVSRGKATESDRISDSMDPAIVVNPVTMLDDDPAATKEEEEIAELPKSQEPEPELAEEQHPAEDVQESVVVTGGGINHTAKSLGIFSIEHPVRKFCRALVVKSSFDHFILFCILLNAVTMGMVDYSYYDYAKEEWTISVPGRGTSAVNQMNQILDPILLGIFVLEMTAKVIAWDLFKGEGAYLKSAWNWIDFTVVIFGLLESIPGLTDAFPGASSLRTVRVLRPLRTLTRFPSMRNLVTGLLSSVFSLGNTLLLFIFIFTIFSILALQLWGCNGALHGRCRLTPHPLRMPANLTSGQLLHLAYGREEYRNNAATYSQELCLVASSSSSVGSGAISPSADQKAVANDDAAWTKRSSPWANAQDCYWPMDEDETLQPFCSLDGMAGLSTCKVGTYCGANYDNKGNPRFADMKVLHSDVFDSTRDWGYNQFEHVGGAFISVFQIVTLESWAPVMYRTMDSYVPVLSATYYVVLMVTGSFFVINLFLGVLFDGFARQAQARADNQARQALRKLAALDVDGNGKLSAVELKDGHAPFNHVSLRTIDEAMRILEPGHQDGGELAITIAGWQKLQRVLHAVIKEERERRIEAGTERLATLVPWPRKALVPSLEPIVTHIQFNNGMLVVILLNTVVLAMDKHPMDPGTACSLEQASFACTTIFIVEMLMNMGGLGLDKYFADNFMTFDFVVSVLI